MTDVYQITGVGLLEGKQRLEAISVNAASGSLTGYRRHIVTGHAFDAVLMPPDAAAMDGMDPALAAPSFDEAGRSEPHHIDLRPGAMMATGRALDLAIDGDELFFALTDGTQTWLTRAGSFRLDEEGVLLGERGLRVVGVHGDVRLPGSDVEVAADGRITRDGVIVAALQLFRPIDRMSLQPAHGSLLASPAGVQPAETGAGRIQSGMLEASNTDSAREMLSLMSISRQFEALSQVVRGYDESLGQTIRKLGEI
jgi:flagellar basal body rod protein FlgG